jgi:hypothetical protein
MLYCTFSVLFGFNNFSNRSTSYMVVGKVRKPTECSKPDNHGIHNSQILPGDKTEAIEAAGEKTI